jgi:exopolysaccharide biosynthesis polyprenyl glycosylphosphotransferase
MLSKQLIRNEILGIFLLSLIVSTFRFRLDFLDIFKLSPGIINLVVYPLTWYLLLYRNHAWEQSNVRFSPEFFVAVFRAGWQSFVLFAAYAYLAKDSISRLWLILNTCLTLVFLLTNRWIFRMYKNYSLEKNVRLKYIYIGTPNNELASRGYFESYYGFSPQFEVISPPEFENAAAWFENYAHLIEHARDHIGVIVSVGAIQDASLLRQISDYRRDKVIDFLLESRIGTIISRFETLESPILLRVRQSAIVSSGAILKRMFDIVAAFVLLIVCVPLFLIVPILIKLSSPGPVFYIDDRLGQDLKKFRFPKFRTMYVGANVQRGQTLGAADDGIVERYKSDPRIFPLGRFLRRWSIDELPQLWTVLTGSMSIVGPRPILEEELIQVERKYEVRFMAKPGLTGLWQVTGRKEVAWRDRMVRDISYIDNWSLGYDLLLIIRTISAILRGKGAH